MPTEVKQRKRTPKQSDEGPEPSAASCKDEAHKVKTEAGKSSGASKTSPGLDMRSFLCVLSLAACGALSW